ncbi:MAG: sigma 54-interacting transcriptional regulator [Firmicutes bacterium]|nr:sigma 54-interacting transcriptional regulator [Bacillota bacterium]HOB34911.1 sigma 54-interacting transcriptional regulator [Bacillota bacterium]HQE02022.1 sigma 54-interacting transcriptional regulator [Bacillota bacterium]
MSLAEAVLAVVLQQSNHGIHMVDTEGITRYYNGAAAEMDGLEVADVLGKHVLDVFPSLNKDTSTLLRVARTGKPIIDQHQVYTNLRGVEIETINTTLPVFGRQGALLGAVEVARDISQIRKLTEQIVELRRRLSAGTGSPDSRQTARYRFDDIVGSSPALRDVVARAALAAHTDSPVLVIGETGTGKELLVQAIHNESPRRNMPFVAQNCAALPESLLDALLFGSVKGSFTGARDLPGLFELADKGTLFLDELNALPRPLQAKLLRVLETGELRRLGDTKSRKADVRIIAAMSRDPSTTLRPDLYYRLNVVSLTLPPLRQRKEDIPLLCRHFLAKHNAKLGTRVTGISAQALELLKAWPWPGNIRELSNLLEGVLNFRSAGLIEPEDLPEQYRAGAAPQSLRAKVAKYEENLIRQALQANGGNISRTAEYLQIPRQTLQRRLKDYSWHDSCI